MTNYILEYWDKIQSGEIVACRRIKQQYKKLVDDIHNPKRPYIFDVELATRPIEFIENFCRQAQGSKAGQKLKLELFQKAKFQAIFGFVHEDTRLRKYRETMTIEGRKNGKTTENSALSIYMLMGDGEGSAECYFIATKKDQATIGFTESHKMVRQSKTLSKHVKKRQGDIISFEATHSKLQALASDSNTLDGLNSHFVTVDELAAIKERNVYDVMKQSTSSRDQPLVNSISTNGFVRDSIYDTRYQYACDVLDGKVKDERFLAFIYELDEREEWRNESMWIKANPGLGTIKKLDTLRAFVEEAKHEVSAQKTVLTKDFNLKENSTSSWLTTEQIENPETYNLPDLGIRYGIAGFDLSETTDLTSACVLMRRPNDDKIYIKMMFWLPGEMIEKRSLEDKIPYTLYEQQGLLRPSGEHKIDKLDVLKWFLEVQEEEDVYIPWIGYDQWSMDDPTLEEFRGHFGKDSMIVIRQGFQTLSGPMKELVGDLGANVFNYNNNPLLKMCLRNTDVKTDENGNIRPIKGRNQRKRIDGTIALLCAFTVYIAKKDDYLGMI